ncbi:MAG: hypothetical protein ACREIT_09375 [Tepidisphaeraceae bacterium]
MRVEDFKRWHWVIVGLLAGAGVAYVWVSTEPVGSAFKTSQPNFETYLVQRRDTKEKDPHIKDIVVYPPEDTVNGEVRSLVLFHALTPSSDKKGWVYRPQVFYAKVPYHPLINPPPGAAQDRNYTIQKYLAEVRKQHPHVSFHYAWYRTPQWMYGLWITGSVVVIGGVWPTVLGLLAGAGFGRPPREKEYDLDRFGKAEPDPAKAVATIPADASDKLNQLNDEIEKSLGLEATAPAPVDEDQSKHPVKQLSSKPLDPSATPDADPDGENIEYKGEFYPTARKKK